MSDPANFRPSRYHVRDYGLLTSNPFGQKVFGDAEKSRVAVPANTPFRLRFGMFIHGSAGPEFDRKLAYDDYVRRIAEMNRPTP